MRIYIRRTSVVCPFARTGLIVMLLMNWSTVLEASTNGSDEIGRIGRLVGRWVSVALDYAKLIE